MTDTAAAVHDNWRAWLRVMAGHAGVAWRRFGRVSAARAGDPELPFDQVFALTPPGPGELSAALSWVAASAEAFWVLAAEEVADGIRPELADRGLHDADVVLPGMARALPATASDVRGPAPTDGATVRAATTSADLEAVAALTAAAFGMPVAAARRLAAPTMLEDDACAWLLAHRGGEPVGCGLSFRTDGVAGIYGLAVPPAWRRRGIGAALTRELLQVATAAGCRTAVLQASPLGASVFADAGFTEVARYRVFAPAA